MLTAVGLDDDVAGDIVTEDHGGNEGEGEEVKVTGEQTEDCSSDEDVKDVEAHSDNQLAVG